MEKNITLRKHVETLIEKAAKAEELNEAMRFSQAACNAAHAICELNTAAAAKLVTSTHLTRIRFPHPAPTNAPFL